MELEISNLIVLKLENNQTVIYVNKESLITVNDFVGKINSNQDHQSID